MASIEMLNALLRVWGSFVLRLLWSFIFYCSLKMKQPHYSNTLFVIELSQCLFSHQAFNFSQTASLAFLFPHYQMWIACNSSTNGIQRLLLRHLICNWLSRFAQLKLPLSIPHAKFHLYCSISLWVMQLNHCNGWQGINLPCNRFGALVRRPHSLQCQKWLWCLRNTNMKF